MKILIYFLFAVFSISLVATCTSSGNGTLAKTLPAAKFNETLSAERGILIDVRSPEEYAEGHIEHAVNFNVNGDNFKMQIDTLNKNTAYFLYCRSGKRSAKAMDLMREKGFKKLYNLEGGITAWQENNFRVTGK